MRRFLFILSSVIIYTVAISTALGYLPFADAPTWFRLIFKTKYAILIWFKIRHTLIVLACGVMASACIVKCDAEKRYFDAWAIGISSFLFGVFEAITIKYQLCKEVQLPFTWANTSNLLEVTDHLLILFAIPVFVGLFSKFWKIGNKTRSNQVARPDQ